ncbi:hypothetical protein [Chamaesiphon polymorphus]|uniref:Uncharacterized protein n=1 Tax=Chamaesiphon polymorphus CCALA 037 TaxID=2107692 RepID=A0A2T1GBR3_9CYAN|nr:hypothetical protein [Chamaesiphon polymorphus]PSB54709.1 hypothetical protein C7B77_17275 [Chamaesiphon polymorphus CCALA 037]
MMNIFNYTSIENYLHEILRYALDVESLSICSYKHGVCLVNIILEGEEYCLKIICPEETDIQFGYKFTRIAIQQLKQLVDRQIVSEKFCDLVTIYQVLINKSPLVYKDRMISVLFPGKNYRLAILYGLIREIEKSKEIEFICPT